MSEASVAILVAALGFLGTLCGSYFSNRKSSALIAYRLEQLEIKVDKHNHVIERTFNLETEAGVIKEHLGSIDKEIQRLGKYHQP